MRKRELLKILKDRFTENEHRHSEVTWSEIEPHLNETKINRLLYMEETGGEPDVVKFEDGLWFFDCSSKSPDRRSLCYDQDARINRKKFPPESSAVEEAKKHDLQLMTEAQYLHLQSLDHVDEKTTSWVQTEQSVRERGGALFGNYHYGRVFIYHNGADSYYSSRGFRVAFQL